MTGVELALVALGIGARHATDPDHLAAIATMLDREADLVRASRLAALWGIGHGASFVAIGLPIVLLDLHVPTRFEPVASLVVAALLIGLGVGRLVSVAPPLERGTRAEHARPLVVGLAHGLAGSAGVALLAATNLDSRASAAGYLVLVAIGTLVGMVLATIALARPLVWTARRDGSARHLARLLPAMLSIGLGIAVGRDAIATLV